MNIQDIFNDVVNEFKDMAEKMSKNDTYYIRTYDIPNDTDLCSGFLKKDGNWNYFLVVKKDEQLQPLIGIIVHDSKVLRRLSKELITCAEKMEEEIATETTP